MGSTYPQSSMGPAPPIPSELPNPVKQLHNPVVVSQVPRPLHTSTSFVPTRVSSIIIESVGFATIIYRGQ